MAVTGSTPKRTKPQPLSTSNSISELLSARVPSRRLIANFCNGDDKKLRLLAPPRIKWLRVAILPVVVLLLLIVACSSDSGEAEAPAEGAPVVVRASDLFDVDSFVNAGWKKSKEYSTETVPSSRAIWYGFYQSQDVEIRFYASHADALGPGMDSANTLVGRVPNSSFQGTLLGYSDFMVAGNTVILCQTLIEVCEELVENIP